MHATNEAIKTGNPFATPAKKASGTKSKPERKPMKMPRPISSTDFDAKISSSAGDKPLCQWLHEQLELLPLVRFPFTPAQLPTNGIYFFYEDGEAWRHGLNKPRIVRIGSHRDGNFRSRINDHFLLSKSEMTLQADRPAPKDRSIFRKNLGRALLAKADDSYLKVWDIDFTSKANQKAYGHLRNLDREDEIEANVTTILREGFSFRFVLVEGQEQRMGTAGLEGALIGTVAHCRCCRPSPTWLGNSSPLSKIRESGLWLVQHLKHPPMTAEERLAFSACVARTQSQYPNP